MSGRRAAPRISASIAGSLRALLRLSSRDMDFVLRGLDPKDADANSVVFDRRNSYGCYETGRKVHPSVAAAAEGYLLSRRSEIHVLLQAMAEPLGLSVIDLTGEVHSFEPVCDASRDLQLEAA